jgi:hypothetical protein
MLQTLGTVLFGAITSCIAIYSSVRRFRLPDSPASGEGFSSDGLALLKRGIIITCMVVVGGLAGMGRSYLKNSGPMSQDAEMYFMIFFGGLIVGLLAGMVAHGVMALHYGRVFAKTGVFQTGWYDRSQDPCRYWSAVLTYLGVPLGFLIFFLAF